MATVMIHHGDLSRTHAPQDLKNTLAEVIPIRSEVAETDTTPNVKKPNYALRRAAVGSIALAAAVTVGTVVGGAVHSFVERRQPTLPDRQEIQAHPDKYKPVTVGYDGLDAVAQAYTDHQHDFRPNTAALQDQLGGRSSVGPRTTIEVPIDATTTSTTTPSSQAQDQQ